MALGGFAVPESAKAQEQIAMSAWAAVLVRRKGLEARRFIGVRCPVIDVDDLKISAGTRGQRE
ncbi:hypothetical protein GCM10009744_10260 [Kribbella alba]|uniref:Uncharacterized protein n=1 Tax=Kribbella alba TaxID=190197 RepID=A0ABP4QWY2_9ACTN